MEGNVNNVKKLGVSMTFWCQDAQHEPAFQRDINPYPDFFKYQLCQGSRTEELESEISMTKVWVSLLFKSQSWKTVRLIKHFSHVQSFPEFPESFLKLPSLQYIHFFL